MHSLRRAWWPALAKLRAEPPLCSARRATWAHDLAAEFIVQFGEQAEAHGFQPVHLLRWERGLIWRWVYFTPRAWAPRHVAAGRFVYRAEPCGGVTVLAGDALKYALRHPAFSCGNPLAPRL
jgi:hypothetical protein